MDQLAAITGLLAALGTACGTPGDDEAQLAAERQAADYSHCDNSPGEYPYLTGKCDGRRIKHLPRRGATPVSAWRAWRCPATASVPPSYQPALGELGAIRSHVDTRALTRLALPQGLSMAVINIKRDGAHQPHYRYFMTGDGAAARESWSSSKFMVVAAAAARARDESGYRVGLTGRTSTGEQLGDLVTWIHNYERDGSYASNALARYFLHAGGRAHANRLMTTWLGAGESRLGEFYGQFYPEGIGLQWLEGEHRHDVDHRDEVGEHKRVAPLAAAEFLKRLVMHREDHGTRLPGFRGDAAAGALWPDLEALFYGSPGQSHGGMQDDTAIYLEAAVDIAAMEARAPGQWRIFSKLGHGQSESRDRLEFVYVAYACWPHLAQPAWGKEFVLAAHYSLPVPVQGRVMDRALAAAIRRVVGALVDGSIDQLADPVSTEPLGDVVGHWAETDIRALAASGLMRGYPDGRFRPQQAVRRGEFAALLAAAFAPPAQPACAGHRATDTAGHWAEDAIATVMAACIMRGLPDGTFQPDAPIDKAAATAALAAVLHLPAASDDALDQFRDAAAIPDWARPQVAAAARAGLAVAHPYPERFEPTARATRAEIAVALARALATRAQVAGGAR